MKDVPIEATTSAAKQMMQDPKLRIELQLIYNAKANPYNPVAWQKVYDLFNPIVRTAIRTSGVLKLNLSNIQVENQANQILRDAIRDYNINNAAGAKPASFFSTRLIGGLSKIKRAGRMISATEKNESTKVLVNKAQNLLRAQSRPDDANSIYAFLKKEGYNTELSEIQKVLLFNTKEFNGSQVIGGDDASNSGIITYQEVLDAKKTKTPKQLIDERNKMLHVYNNIYSFKEKEFLKAVLWMWDDKLGLGKPATLTGPKPSNFKELCGIYKIGWEKGKKIYLDFLRAAGEL